MASARDPGIRKSSQLNRLRHQLRKKREALADHFDYKMYMIFHFKEQVKPCAVFEIAEVVPVMTNNYEDSILKGAKDEAYSYQSTLELLERDVVQLHAPRWQSMRKDVLGCTTEIDFFLWPRSDILNIECKLFSRWKGDQDAPFKPIQASFQFSSDDYEKQLLRLLTKKEKTGLIINNPSQSMFLFVDRHHLETAKRKAIVFKLSSACLYLPQDQLTNWGPGTCSEEIDDLLSSPDSSKKAQKCSANCDAAQDAIKHTAAGDGNRPQVLGNNEYSSQKIDFCEHDLPVNEQSSKSDIDVDNVANHNKMQLQDGTPADTSTLAPDAKAPVVVSDRIGSSDVLASDLTSLLNIDASRSACSNELGHHACTSCDKHVQPSAANHETLASS